MLHAKVDRAKKKVIITFEDPRLRTYTEEMPFEVWWKFSSDVEKKIAKSHRA